MKTFLLKLSLLLFIFILYYNASMAQSEIDPSLRKATDFAHDFLKCYVENEEMPGLAFAVAHKGQVVYSEGFGWSDLEQKVPVKTNTRFRLASLSKLFMTATIAKLMEAGLLDLDNPIRTYIPEFPEKRWPITIRQIVAHISGIRGYKDEDFEEGKNIHQRKYTTTKEALAIFEDDSLLFEPGTNYQYSTFAFTLLTAVVENITGKLYEDYLREEVLTPLGITSVVPDRPEKIISNRSRFYEPNEDRSIAHASPIRTDFKFGGGGMLGSAEDLVRLGSAHIKPGFFQAQTLQEDLFVEQALKSGRSVNIGMAWRIGIDEDFGKVYHHSGSLPGGRSVLMVWPDHELVLAAISNTTNAPYYAEEFAQTLSHLFLTALDGFDISCNQFKHESQILIFSGVEATGPRLLTLLPSFCSGSIDTPPHIAKELEKRHFPPVNSLKVIGTYSNSDQSISVILASDIGLHRLQLTGYGTSSAKGFIVELANKFEWEVVKHDFKGAK